MQQLVRPPEFPLPRSRRNQSKRALLEEMDKQTGNISAGILKDKQTAAPEGPITDKLSKQQKEEVIAATQAQEAAPAAVQRNTDKLTLPTTQTPQCPATGPLTAPSIEQDIPSQERSETHAEDTHAAPNVEAQLAPTTEEHEIVETPFDAPITDEHPTDILPGEPITDEHPIDILASVLIADNAVELKQADSEPEKPELSPTSAEAVVENLASSSVANSTIFVPMRKKRFTLTVQAAVAAAVIGSLISYSLLPFNSPLQNVSLRGAPVPATVALWDLATGHPTTNLTTPGQTVTTGGHKPQGTKQSGNHPGGQGQPSTGQQSPNQQSGNAPVGSSPNTTPGGGNGNGSRNGGNGSGGNGGGNGSSGGNGSGGGKSSGSSGSSSNPGSNPGGSTTPATPPGGISTGTTSPSPTPAPTPTPTPVPLISELSGSYQEYNQFTNLSYDGNLDWIHWGLNGINTAVDRKAGVTPLISNFTQTFGSHIYADQTWPIDFGWNDGNPTGAEGTTTSAIYCHGLGNGWTISVPASTSWRTLRFYVGAYEGQGEMIASMQGTGGYANSSLNVIGYSGKSDNAVYTFTFRSNQPGIPLVLTWKLIGEDTSIAKGGIEIESASLQG